MFNSNLLIKIFIVLLVFVPAVAFAYTTPSLWPAGFWGPIVSCTGNYLNGNTTGTCQNLCDLINTAINVIYLAMSIAIFVIAPILFVVGGIILMVSGANPAMLEKGKKTLTDTLIGLIIVLCSYLIVNTVITTLHINGIGGFGASSCSLGGAGTTTNSVSVPVGSASAPAQNAPVLGPSQGGSSGGAGANFGGGSSGGAGASGPY